MENLKAIEEKERVKKEQQEERMENRKRKPSRHRKLRRKNIEPKKQANHTQRKSQKGQKDTQLSFTEDKVLQFEIWFKNGYDLKNDYSYDAWLKTRTTDNEPLCKASR